MRPLVVLRVASPDLAVPVKAETYLVQLLAIAVDIVDRRDGGVLARLDGVLLGGEAVGVVAHGVEHIVSLLALVACVYVGGDIAQRMSHMESCTRRIGKHVEYIVLGLIGLLCDVVGLAFCPAALPLLLYLLEVVFHFSWFVAAIY